MKIEIKFIQTPVKKDPNMTLLAMRINLRILLMSDGNATVAPARSSSRMMATGLNQ